MLLSEHELSIPAPDGADGFLRPLVESVKERVGRGFHPVRMAVTQSDEREWHCEVGGFACDGGDDRLIPDTLFDFRRRAFERTEGFTTALMIPTGIGAEVGGHAGDAGPVAKLLAQVSDRLVLHPNVVNASDINEMPPQRPLRRG